MKLILKNSNVVFSEAYSQVQYTSTQYKYLSEQGSVEDTTAQTNFVTDAIQADNYLINGTFTHASGKVNVAWYDSNGDKCGTTLIPNSGSGSISKEYNVQLVKPADAVTMRIAYIYRSDTPDYDLNLSIYKKS